MEYYVLFTADRTDWKLKDAAEVAALLLEADTHIADIVPVNASLPLDELFEAARHVLTNAIRELAQDIEKHGGMAK